MAPSKKGVKNAEVMDYRVNEGLNQLMSQKELQEWMEVSVRLSNEGIHKIDAIIDNLKENRPDIECIQQSDVLVVSGYSPSVDFGEGKVLAIVRKHDRRARIA